MKKIPKKQIGLKSLAVVRNYCPKVTSVVDATKPVLVEVTPQDVRNAKIGDPQECALAVACVRALHCTDVIIGLTTSYIVVVNKAIRYKNGEAISREVVSFDRKAGFDVGLYRLVPPSASNRLDQPRPSGTQRGPKPKQQRVFRHFTQGVRVLRHS